jgi:dTDP-4-dehydrorhamnose 3,5-epimerase
MDNPYNEPKLIRGGLAVDDRGELSFCNDFQFAGIKRFYTVRNHRAGFVRAWHAHKNEHKFIGCLSGAAKVSVVNIEAGGNWENPPFAGPCAMVESLQKVVTLSAHLPGILHIPAGWANGWMSLTDDALLAFYSTSTLEESQADDFRYPADWWNCWEVEAR